MDILLHLWYNVPPVFQMISPSFVHLAMAAGLRSGLNIHMIRITIF